MYSGLAKVNIFLNGVFILICIVLLLNELTSFEIKSQPIKSFVYFGVLIFTPSILILNLFVNKTNKRKITTAIFPSLVLIGIFILGPMKMVFKSSVWKTQIILYQSKQLSFKKVEFQMQDVGALGYHKRTKEITYLTDLFMIVNPIDKDINESLEWVKVEKVVNELGLKYP